MVHLDKVEGQTGSLVLHEDGSIISSSGDLSSSEQTAQTIQNLLSHTLQVEFNNPAQQQASGGQNGYVNTTVVPDNGNNPDPTNNGIVVSKWNRITVTFGTTSYVTCLSNKRVHVIKKESKADSQQEQAADDQ